MTIDVLMPALSPTMEEGTLAKWHVKVGDEVKPGDVPAVQGSGPRGRVIRADVEGAKPGAAAPAPTPAAAPPAPAPATQALAPKPAAAPGQSASLEQMGIPPGSYDLKPLDMMRKTVARRLSES